MLPRRCIGFDRIIETDRPVLGTLPLGLAEAAHEESGDAIRIKHRPAINAWADVRPLWTYEDGRLDFAPAGIAHYRCTIGSITVDPVRDAPADMVEALLIATALPAVLWLQGAFVVHASAVVPCGERHAIAIAGRSGSGKSRLAAAFLAAGGHLIADDSIAVACDAAETRCAGLAGGYHLGAPDAEERPFHPVVDGMARRSGPLAALVVLDDAASTPERLHGVKAVAALLSNRHRASAAYHGGLEPRSLGTAALLARTIRVYRWPRSAADMLLDADVRRRVTHAGEDR